MRVLCVAPMTREARVADAVACGAGARATAFVDRALATGEYDAVMLAGVCGGLDPSLMAGAVIVARRAIDASAGDGIDVDPALRDAVRARLRARSVPFVSAPLLTVDAALLDATGRRDAWNLHGAAGVDMESYGVAAAALRHGVPWIAVRVVLDPAGMELPRSLAAWRGEDDERAIAREALRHPREWPAYTRLALQSRAAMRTLTRIAPLARDAVADLPAATRASRVVEAIALV